MGAHSDYRHGLLARFQGRDLLSKEELYQRYWKNHALNQDEVFDLFNLIEEAYDIPAGLLRPNDSIEKLTDRVPHRRWWRSPIHDVIAGDREFWLQEKLNGKLKKYGIADRVQRVHTIDELIHMWCGHLPEK